MGSARFWTTAEAVFRLTGATPFEAFPSSTAVLRHRSACPLAVARPVRLPGVATRLASGRARPQGLDPPTSPLRFYDVAAADRPMLPWASGSLLLRVSRSRRTGAPRIPLSPKALRDLGCRRLSRGSTPSVLESRRVQRARRDGSRPTEADRYSAFRRRPRMLRRHPRRGRPREAPKNLASAPRTERRRAHGDRLVALPEQGAAEAASTREGRHQTGWQPSRRPQREHAEASLRHPPKRRLSSPKAEGAGPVPEGAGVGTAEAARLPCAVVPRRSGARGTRPKSGLAHVGPVAGKMVHVKDR